MSADEIEALADPETANLDHKTLIACRYVKHLALNNGRVLNPKLLEDLQALYTDKQIRYIDSTWAFSNGMTWIVNVAFSAMHKLHIVSHPKLQLPKPKQEKCEEGT